MTQVPSSVVGTAGSDSKRPKDRSPNYPALTFTDALDKAEKIWAQDKTHNIPVAVAAQHMGFKSATSGASAPVFAALKRYRLIEPAQGDSIRVTQEANRLLIYPKDSPERNALIRKLAMTPPIFQQVLKAFPDGLPSDPTLAARLRADFHFASQEAATAFIRTLRHAVKLGGVDGAHAAAQDDTGAIAKEDEPMVNSQPITQPPNPPNPGASTPPPQVGKPERHSVKLDDSSWAEIVITGAPSRRAREKLEKYVKLFIVGEDEG